MTNVKEKRNLSTRAITPSIPRCLLAILYDSILLIPMLMLTGSITLAIETPISTLNSDIALPLQTITFIKQIVFLLTIFSFFSWFWLKNGQTLGMQAWRIKLVSTSGDPISLRQTILRFLSAILSTGCFGLGYLWVVFDNGNRTWHDIISKTQLILLPKVAQKNK